MPFDGDIIHLLVVLAVALYSGILSSKAGMLVSEHPDSPRTSMLQPILQSGMSTIRVIDSLLDISSIRIVFVQVCSPYCADLCICIMHSHHVNNAEFSSSVAHVEQFFHR
jgi:hypothetical protein